MALDTFTAKLSNIDIFQGLADTHLMMIARRAERIMFRAGQTIIAAGTAGEAAFVLIGGESIAVGAGEAGADLALSPGTLVGELAMFMEHDYRVTVMAKGAVKALKLPRASMLELMLADPALAEHFVQRISARLSRVALELRRVDEVLVQASQTVSPVHLPRNPVTTGDLGVTF